MARSRLDQALVARRLIGSRSQAESYIKLGHVQVNGQVVTKPGKMVDSGDNIKLTAEVRYVSRGALKLASVADKLGLQFSDRIVLDVGSSTGGFTDYSLQHGATKVIAVDVGTAQLHPSLVGHQQIELHEQTDIRQLDRLSEAVDIVLIDVSFISIRQVLLHLQSLLMPQAMVVGMVKPQFEAQSGDLTDRGVIKNDHVRRQIFKNFERWVLKHGWIIQNKSDSEVTGALGNRERFYVLRVGRQS